jgi:hypothetical protein
LVLVLRPGKIRLLELVGDVSPILIGSQQKQHVELHIDDLDHDRQLTRSKHEAHGGEDDHLVTAMDP